MGGTEEPRPAGWPHRAAHPAWALRHAGRTAATSGARAAGKASALCCNSHIWVLLKPWLEDVKHMLDCQPSSTLHVNRQDSRLARHRRGGEGPRMERPLCHLPAHSPSHSIPRVCLETPAVPKRTQPCCSPQTKTGTTTLRSGLRRGEICPNTLAVLLQHPTKTGAVCSPQ